MINDAELAHPPETLEGWYVLHQIFRTTSSGEFPVTDLSQFSGGDGKGWSGAYQLIGSLSDLLVIHFRPTLEEISVAGSSTKKLVGDDGSLEYSFLSITEAGLYHLTAELARDAAARGGKVGDEKYSAALAERSKAELESAHVRKRLYPERPESMPYVCFYPMSKRRDAGQNWYTLSLDERSRLMGSHGMTGRKYAGKIQQVISGAIGFDNWEWGVTLFASDPINFKKLVTEMRFDEVSAKYAEFGDFYVGKAVNG